MSTGLGRAATLTSSGALLRLVLNFGGMLVLARLIAPTEFGVYAFVSGIVLLIAYLSEIGSSWALLQFKTFRPDHAGSALALALSLASVASLAVVALAHPLAEYMEMPAARGVLITMCLVVPIQAASGVPRALLRRRFEFGRLVRVDLSAAVVALFAGLLHAWIYASVYSLVVQAVVYQLTTSVGLWRRTRREELGRPSRAGIRDLVAFAGAHSLYELLMFVSKNADTFMVAKALGAGALGVYSRAFALVFTPLGQVYTAIGTVAFSAMSRVQDDNAALLGLHRRFIVVCVLGIAVPLASLSPFADEFVLILLGDPWRDAGPVLELLLLAVAVQVMYANLLWVLQATAQLKVQIHAGVILAVVNVAGFVVGLVRESLTVFALAYVVSSLTSLAYVGWRTHLTLKVGLRFYGGLFGAMCLAWGLAQGLHSASASVLDGPWRVMGVWAAFGVLVGAVMSVVFKRQVVESLRSLRRTQSTVSHAG